MFIWILDFVIFMLVMAVIVVGISVFQNWNHKEDKRILEDFPLDQEIQDKYGPRVREFQNLHSRRSVEEVD